MSDVNTKAALSYLAASGAVLPISIIESGGVCTFRAGGKIDPNNAVAVYWASTAHQASDDDWWSPETPESKTVAVAVLTTARKLAGKAPNAAEAEAALHQSATINRTVLTPHKTMMARAEVGAKRVDDYLAGLRGTGILTGFNREFKKRRMAAAATGAGYMTYKIALGRLRLALVPMLATGQKPTVGLFETIFR
jgi:hypothetical protein